MSTILLSISWISVGKGFIVGLPIYFVIRFFKAKRKHMRDQESWKTISKHWFTEKYGEDWVKTNRPDLLDAKPFKSMFH
jgi:hypothetical protein